jgi:hypothetical protein
LKDAPHIYTHLFRDVAQQIVFDYQPRLVVDIKLQKAFIVRRLTRIQSQQLLKPAVQFLIVCFFR